MKTHAVALYTSGWSCRCTGFLLGGNAASTQVDRYADTELPAKPLPERYRYVYQRSRASVK